MPTNDSIGYVAGLEKFYVDLAEAVKKQGYLLTSLKPKRFPAKGPANLYLLMKYEESTEIVSNRIGDGDMISFSKMTSAFKSARTF